MNHAFGYFHFYDGMIGAFRANIQETGQWVQADSMEELEENVEAAIREYYAEHPTYRQDIFNRYTQSKFKVIDVDTL